MGIEADHFEAVWTALGNSEAKCLTMLCLDRTPQFLPELDERFLNETGAVWRGSRKLVCKNYAQTLESNGLVGLDLEGFHLTELGEKIGQPIAKKILYESVELPRPLQDTNGQTPKGNGETRAVTTRVLIIELLSRSQRKWTTERLSDELRIPATTVGRNLEHLDSLSMVDYHSVTSEGKGQVQYQLKEGAKREDVARLHKRSHTLTDAVANILFQEKVVDRVSVAKILHQDGFSLVDLDVLEDDVSRVLSGLYVQGICDRDERSSVSLTKIGKDFYDRLINPVQRAVSGDDRLLNQFNGLPWRDRVQEALLRYQRSSGHFCPRTTQSQKSQLLEFLRENPLSRRKDIEAKLNVQHIVFSDLLKAGSITRVTEGAKVWYSLAAVPQFDTVPATA